MSNASSVQPQIDYTNKDYASILAALLQLGAQLVPEWTDQSPNDLGVMLVELFAYMGDTLYYNQDRIAGESFLQTAVERRSIVQLLRLIGYELTPPLSSSAELTLVFKNTTGPVTIPQGAMFKTTAAATGTPVSFQLIDGQISIADISQLQVGYLDANNNLTTGTTAPPPTGSTTVRVFPTLPVVQVDATVASEIVASSDGSANQRYALARSPVVDDTLVVSVDDGGGAGPAAWTRVTSLLESEATDTHYTVLRDENDVVWIQFGDGTYGKIPVSGVNNISAAYCVGGGAKGNVAANTITKAVTTISQLKLVFNPQAASGGADAEATADAVFRGPQQFRAMGRAVTAADYVTLATGFGVGKAIALSAGINTIQLIVAPEGGGAPTDTLKNDLQAYFDGLRIMTSVLDIVDPTYVEVVIYAAVTVLPQFSSLLVQQNVSNAVASLLSFDNTDFNQTLYISKVYEVIQEIEGVAGLIISVFAQNAFNPSAPLPANGQLSFGTASIAPGQAVTAAVAGQLPSWSGFTVVPALPSPPLPGDSTSYLAMSGGR